MSEIVRGGATKAAGSPLPAEILGAASFGTATAMFARPLAVFSAALTHAWTRGFALARHASKLPIPPLDCMHDITIGLPTVIRQFSMAVSIESGNASPVDPIRKQSAAMWPTPRRRRLCPNWRTSIANTCTKDTAEMQNPIFKLSSRTSLNQPVDRRVGPWIQSILAALKLAGRKARSLVPRGRHYCKDSQPTGVRATSC